jgi:acetyl esterase
MPLDPAAAGLLEQMEAAGLPPLNELSPPEARAAAEAFAALAGPGEDVAEVVDRTVPGPDGEVPVRIYTPAASPRGGASGTSGAGGADASDGAPCLVYFHGGGWVIGTLDSTDTICRAVANRAGCVVVSVDYRLAPEHPFPAPLDDCFAALRWVAEHGPDIGGGPGR